MQIEVRLLNKRRAKGELVYCNFEYIIALVDIKESAHHPLIKLQKRIFRFPLTELDLEDGVLTE
jgi:hypothetical protein